MKTIYNKYIRNNWFWINREVLTVLALIVIAFIAVLGTLEILIDKI